MAFLTKKSNSKYYYICYKDSSKQMKWLSTKKKLKADAMKCLVEFENNSNSDKKRIKLSNFTCQILKIAKSNFEINTYKLYSWSLRNLIKFTDDIEVSKINYGIIENYKEYRLKTINDTSLNIELRTLKAIFQKGYNLGYVWNLWFKNIKQINTVNHEKVTITNEEFQKILCTCKNNDIANIIIFARYSGMRISEILNITWDCINENEIKIINNENFKTKTKKYRIIPMHMEIKRILDAIKNDKIKSFKLFPYNMNYVSRYFKKIIRNIGLSEKISFHCLRHTFISNLISSGIDINTVRELAGHTCITTTMLYTHSNKQLKINAINSI